MRKIADKKGVYCRTDTLNYAGTHLLIEMWKAKNISSPEKIEQLLVQAVEACGATLLEVHTHTFSPFNGVSGIAILKESHISIHTWPEFEYAAVDIFVCGNVDPYRAIPVFKQGFETEEIQILELKRGIFDERQLVL